MCIPHLPQLLMAAPPGLGYSQPFSWLCQFLSTDLHTLLVPSHLSSKPVCRAACQLGHVLALIILGGGTIGFGAVVYLVCPVAWLVSQRVQGETTPL